MPPKTRSQGAASPAQLQAVPSRTRARKQPRLVKPQTVLSPISTSPITKRTKPTNALTTRVSPMQILRSTSLRYLKSTYSRLLSSSPAVEQSTRDRSPSPELNDPPCCVHCHRNPFDLNDLPLIAPNIIHVLPNYQDASTQASTDERKESGLTVLPAQTPLKRTREESAGEVEAEPTAKRHQSNPTHLSTQASLEASTRIDSNTSTGRQSKSTPVTPQRKRTAKASITKAQSEAKAFRFSPVSRSTVNSLQLTSNMTWGQMARVHTRRTQLAAGRAKQMQSSEDEEPREPSQSAADQAPTTPQTAPQLQTSFFDSIRKRLDLVPQLPAFTKLLTNPFSPTRSTPDIQEEVSTTSKPEVDSVVPLSPPKNTPRLIPNTTPDFIPISNAQAEAGVDMNENRATSSLHPEANTGNATQSSPGRTYCLEYSEGSSDEEGSDEKSPAPTVKKQKLVETQTPRSVLKTRTGNSTGTLPRTDKRVTFDESPVDTPSKIRSRCHEYSGIHFADAPGQSNISPSSDDDSNLSNSPRTKANTKANSKAKIKFYFPPPDYPRLRPDQIPADFVPTSAHPQPGTYCLDYNTYAKSDESDSDDEDDEDYDMTDWNAHNEAAKRSIVVGEPGTPTPIGMATSTVATTPALALPTPTPRIAPATPRIAPTTSRIAHAELPATADARVGITIHTDSNAGPSSTPKATDARVLTDVTQEQINRVRSTAEQSKSNSPSGPSQVGRATSVPPPIEDEYNEFDAGWPEPRSYVEAGVCSQRVFDTVSRNWDPRDDVIGDMVYEQSLQEWTDAHRLEREQGVPVRIDWGDDEDEEL
jgi:hypothetical protein